MRAYKLHGKKAIELWVSWILLIALSVALASFMYSWFVGTAETTTSGFKYVYDRNECDNIAVLAEACRQAQTLNINVSNKLLLTVDGLMFRIIYSDYSSNVTELDVNIKPAEKQDYKIGFNSSKTLLSVEVIPIIYTGNTRIVCRTRLAEFSQIALC